MKYFWYYHAENGGKLAHEWLKTVPSLAWFLEKWDAGLATKSDGSPLGSIVKSGNGCIDDGGKQLAVARKKKLERSAKDREIRDGMKSSSGGSTSQKKGKKSGKK